MGDSAGLGTRNFTVSTEERVRALVGGPPAYMRRRRMIEDLEESIVQSIRWHEEHVPFDVDAPAPAIARAFSSLCDLVDAHNRYYPIEANLPIDIASGELREGNRRWAPMPRPTWKGLLARAR